MWNLSKCTVEFWLFVLILVQKLGNRLNLAFILYFFTKMDKFWDLNCPRSAINSSILIFSKYPTVWIALLLILFPRMISVRKFCFIWFLWFLLFFNVSHSLFWMYFMSIWFMCCIILLLLLSLILLLPPLSLLLSFTPSFLFSPSVLLSSLILPFCMYFPFPFPPFFFFTSFLSFSSLFPSPFPFPLLTASFSLFLFSSFSLPFSFPLFTAFPFPFPLLTAFRFLSPFPFPLLTAFLPLSPFPFPLSPFPLLTAFPFPFFWLSFPFVPFGYLAVPLLLYIILLPSTVSFPFTFNSCVS